MSIDTEKMWGRITEALGTSKVSEVQEKLRDVVKTVQAVYKWQKGDVPSLDALVLIASLSGCSIHWLLTGEESLLSLMPHEMKWQVQKQAKATGKTVAQIVVNLAHEHLYSEGKVPQPDEQMVESFEMSTMPDEKAGQIFKEMVRAIVREETKKS